MGVESIGNSGTEIMRFAGCREDMPDKEVEDFLEEVTERRGGSVRIISARKATRRERKVYEEET